MREVETLLNPHASRSGNALSSFQNAPGIAVFIMSHPLLERIGHCYFHPLDKPCVAFEINRTQPMFAPDSTPLADPYINRTGMSIRSTDNQYFTVTKQNPKLILQVADQVVEDSITVERSCLVEGLALQLNQRVCLLLKICPPVQRVDHQRFLMYGLSDSLNQLCRHIAFLSPTNEPVLIRGATGTGKELVARAIVKNSPRHDKPFISVNLAAISESLAAAELFGSAKGAYTGAQKQRDGFLQAADGGTLFLDEIGEAKADLQAMLLRVLETGELFPVGSTVPVKVDVRIIAATDAKLDQMIEQGDFKAPLLYRLANFELTLEDLAARKQDMSLLFVHFAKQVCGELGISPGQNLLAPSWLPSDLMQQLLNYHWPGNIREFRNAVRQIVISAHSAPELALPADFAAKKLGQASLASPETRTQPPSEPVKQPKRKPASITKAELLASLTQYDYEVSKTAQSLNISRASVYLLMKQFDIPSVNDLADQQILPLLAEHKDIVVVAKALKVSHSSLRRRVNQLKVK